MSLKRSAPDIDLPSPGNSSSTASSSPSQRPRVWLAGTGDDAASYTDRGWNSVWQEIIGLTPEVNGFEQDEPNYLYGDDSEIASLPLCDGQANMEAWSMQELHDHESPIDEVFLNHMSVTGQEIQDSVECDTCYGMVYQSKMKLLGNMTEVLASLNLPDISQIRSHYLLPIVFENGRLMVATPGGTCLAQLNDLMNESLGELVAKQEIELLALVHKKRILDDIGAAARSKDAQTSININVYGPRSCATSIGRKFSSSKIWLQRPDWSKPGAAYDNPHFLKIDVEPCEPLDDNIIVEDPVCDDTDNGLHSSLENVYSMLNRNSHARRTAGDAKMMTPLLPHQEEALDFMLERENGPVREEYQLWKSLTDDSHDWYQHSIAGIKSRSAPVETGGGILADEMGMGKTYSMLALIIKSLGDAERWCQDSETHLADDIPSTKILSQATLVIVPSPSLLFTWLTEIKKRINMKVAVHHSVEKSPIHMVPADDTLRVLVYHGNKRPSNVEDVTSYDVVLTTYHTLIADHRRKQCPITDVAWFRIVLDEAHVIRQLSTFLHRRVAELDAKFRWCLTGTPIQNRLEDIGALLAFLRILPFDRLGTFRQCVVVPFMEVGSRRLLGQQNLARVLDAYCIRRTKAILGLTNIFESTKYVTFSNEEQRQYDKTKEDMKRTMQQLVDDFESKSRFGVFQAQLQLRLLCNHGTFQHLFWWVRARTLLDEHEDAFALAGMYGEKSCSVCRRSISALEDIPRFGAELLCAHILCSKCQPSHDDQCPLCQTIEYGQKAARIQHAHQAALSSEGYFRPNGRSTKMDALIEDIKDSNPEDKGIVFSQWTSTLDLISEHLSRNHISFARIDGTTDIKRRQETLEDFEEKTTFRVLIMTTGVGAFGLNLIAANRVFIVEPHWNPSTELQAIGRTMRIGQQRPVHVTRYIVDGTVEKDMQQLQRRKLKMAGTAKMADSTDTSSNVKPEA